MKQTSLFLLFGVALSSFVGTAMAEPTYRIAGILPLSGDSANGGQACMNGMQLARQKLQGENKNAIELVFEDNGNTPSGTLSAYQKLKRGGDLGGVVVWDDSSGSTLAPLTEKEGVVLMVTGMDPSVVENRKHTFLYWLTMETEIEALLEEIKKRGYQRIGRVTSQLAGPESMSKAMDQLNKGRANIVVDESVPSDSRDFRAVITKLKANKVDAIVSFVWLGQIGVFAKQARSLGLAAHIIGSDLYEDANEVTQAGGAMEGVWFPQIADPLPSFRADYEKAFPGASTYSAANCYDTVMLMAEACRLERNVSDYLSSVQNFGGALGPISATGDHRFVFPAIIKVIEKGQFVNQKK